MSKDIKVTISEEALNTIAVLSEGAMRDALSILERCLQDGDTEITDEKIKDLVGIPKFEYIYQNYQNSNDSEMIKIKPNKMMKEKT